MARWTAGLREAMRRHAGHDKLISVLQRAAFTEPASGGLLLVHAGLDPDRPLAAQGDAFWWNSVGFGQIAGPFGGFSRIFRGFDPAGGGLAIAGYAATLDGGCGRDGSLIAAAIAPDGTILELFEA
jgi:serine/threonine protein phosphatase 1